MDTKNTFTALLYVKKFRRNDDGEAPIYLRLSMNGKTVDISAYRKINIELQDAKSEKVKGTTKLAKNLNNYLLSMKTSIYEHYKEFRESGEVFTATDLKNKYLGREEDKGKKVIELFQEHNENIKKLKGIDFRVNWA